MGAVADRARHVVARVVPAVPPDRVQHAPVGRDVGEHLVSRRVVVDESRGRVHTGRAVVAQEEDPGLAAGPRTDGAVGRARRSLRARLRRVIDDVDPLVRGVELIGRRAHLRVPSEERVARQAVGIEVTAIAGPPAGGNVVLAEQRIVALRLGPRDRLRVGDVLRIGRGEGRNQLRRRKRLSAVGRFRDPNRVSRWAGGLERPECDVNVAVSSDGDVRELQALERRRELHRRAERDAVVGRAREVDRVRAVAVEA